MKERLPPRRNRRQGGDRRGDHQDHQQGHHKPHLTDNRQQILQIGGSLSDPPTIHRHHRGGGETRFHKNPVAVCQHRGDNFRLEGDIRDQNLTNGSNGCKIYGLRRASKQRPLRGRNTCEIIMGGATYMGSGNQRRPPQDCIEIQIQSQPRRGLHPQRTANTRHSGRGARSKESEGAGIIGRHGQSGDDQNKTVSETSASGTTLPVVNQ